MKSELKIFYSKKIKKTMLSEIPYSRDLEKKHHREVLLLSEL